MIHVWLAVNKLKCSQNIAKYTVSKPSRGLSDSWPRFISIHLIDSHRFVFTVKLTVPTTHGATLAVDWTGL